MWSDQEIGFWKEYLQAHHGLDGELERLDGEFDLNIAVRVDGRLDAVAAGRVERVADVFEAAQQLVDADLGEHIDLEERAVQS